MGIGVIEDRPPLVIGDALSGAEHDGAYPVINPATGGVLAYAPLASPSDVGRAVATAAAAFPGWRRLSAPERSAYLRRFAAALDAQREALAQIDALNSGNTIREMRRDVTLAIGVIEYFAALGSELKGETLPPGPKTLHFSVREPFGVVGRIVAFNHPLLFAASRLAAPLVAGNTFVLKPAEQTPLSALFMGRIAAGVFPPGVVNVVSGDGSTTGSALVKHPEVRRIAFIGSVETGRRIQQLAAEGGVKYVTLELGGKNPLIVFPDVDPEIAAEAAVRGMNFQWQGQSCGSTSRLFIHDRLYEAVLERVVARVQAIKVGDPLDESTEMGPMISQRQLEKDQACIQAALEEGGRLAAGGGRPAGVHPQGYFLEPTIVRDVQPGHRLAREEVFGPVLGVIRWSDYEEMIRAVNAVRYGLTASIWTNDVSTALRTAQAVEAGYVWVNDVSVHYLGAGFGGYKESGVGREENLGELLSYTQEKYVTVKLDRV